MTINVMADASARLLQLHETSTPAWGPIARLEIAERITAAVAGAVDAPEAFADHWANAIVALRPLDEPWSNGTSAVFVFDSRAARDLEAELHRLLGAVPDDLAEHELYLGPLSDAIDASNQFVEQACGLLGNQAPVNLTATTWSECLGLLGLGHLDPSCDTVEVPTLRRAILRWRNLGANSPAKAEHVQWSDPRIEQKVVGGTTVTAIVPARERLVTGGRPAGYHGRVIERVEQVAIFATANDLPHVTWA